MMKSILPLALASVLSAPALAQDDTASSESADAASAADDGFAGDNARLSYALGMMIGDRVLKPYGADIDYDLMLEAIKSRNEGGEPRMEIAEAGRFLQEYETKMRAEQSSAAVAEGEAYRKANAEKEGVTVTESGLQYEVLEAGEGESPTAENEVSVHYVGTLIDGTEFDSSYKRNAPATFKLDRVIPGWTEGVQLMKPGSKYRFVIPPELAYGERGAGANIGPNSTLIFEVELLEVK